MKRVYLEITDACNLNCPFCTYPKGNSFMSLDLIENYIGQIKPFCSYIYLHMLGEPLLHPDLEKILDLLDEQTMKLLLVTNGTLLDRYPDILSHSCLNKLSISVHSVNNTGIDDSYFRTIDSLLDKETGKNIELRFYDPDSLDDKLSAYLQSLKERYGFEPTSRKDSYRLKDNVYVYFQELFRWPDINDDVISDTGYCHGGIDMIGINVHSDVTVCCLDPHAENMIGNLKQQSLEEILESERYKKFLTDIRNRKLTFELCRRCSYRLRFEAEDLLQDDR
ncbi:MAG: radical SAM protein [Erysipelotrichaceae bacterium]|nr:radical SAM protein [Erysipelotrichaceae bacterium]